MEQCNASRYKFRQRSTAVTDPLLEETEERARNIALLVVLLLFLLDRELCGGGGDHIAKKVGFIAIIGTAREGGQRQCGFCLSVCRWRERERGLRV